MTQTAVRHAGKLTVNGARLHYERRGTGPAVVFVPGGLADSAHYAEVAQLLADSFTVLTYDRRGNGSSPRPPDWYSTSIGEQADDLAGLIESLGLAPCAVWGGSLGGLVLLELLARRPGLVRAAIVHEPPLFSVLGNGDEAAGQLATAAAAVRERRTGAAMHEHARQALGGIYERLPRDLRERMAGNAEVFFGMEVPGLLRSLPTAGAVRAVLGRLDIPVAFMAGPENRDSPPYAATRWLAGQIGADVREIPGGHMPCAVEARATAAAIGEFAAPGQRSPHAVQDTVNAAPGRGRDR